MYTYWTTDTLKVPHKKDVRTEIANALKKLRYMDGVEIKVEAVRDIDDMPDGNYVVSIKHMEDGITY